MKAETRAPRVGDVHIPQEEYEGMKARIAELEAEVERLKKALTTVLAEKLSSVSNKAILAARKQTLDEVLALPIFKSDPGQVARIETIEADIEKLKEEAHAS